METRSFAVYLKIISSLEHYVLKDFSHRCFKEVKDGLCFPKVGGPFKWKQLEGRGEEAEGGQLIMTWQSTFSWRSQIRVNHSKWQIKL